MRVVEPTPGLGLIGQDVFKLPTPEQWKSMVDRAGSTRPPLEVFDPSVENFVPFMERRLLYPNRLISGGGHLERIRWSVDTDVREGTR
ncbi:MAG: hypothetical protein H0T78_04195 [Longispora sp.]|nr:hypothetical protein [Longispora sp. (in: high G+C Gram-positive bacteria)]